MHKQVLTEYIEEGVEKQVFPGAQVMIRQGTEEYTHVTGRWTYGEDAPLVTETTRYDIASLTKMVLWSGWIDWMAEQDIAWHTPVRSLWADFPYAGVHVAQLLGHATGVRGGVHRQYFSSGEQLWESLMALPQEGEGFWYHCANSIWAGKVLEAVEGRSLAEIVQERVCGPLGMHVTSYDGGKDCPPTEHCPHRGLVQGVVHDEKAYTLGVPVGNAGIFSRAEDMMHLLETWHGGGARGQRWREVWQKGQGHLGGREGACAWLHDRWNVRSTLRYAGMEGHGGFTGCQLLWWPVQELRLVVLSNRSYPHRDHSAFTPWVEGLMGLIVG